LIGRIDDESVLLEAVPLKVRVHFAYGVVDGLYAGEIVLHVAEIRQSRLRAIVHSVRPRVDEFALGVLFEVHPQTLYALRKDSPLLIGLGDEEYFIASDLTAFLERTRRYLLLEQGEIAEISFDAVRVFAPDGKDHIIARTMVRHTGI
jgi:glucosamine 6-phosphate synthetase-like amidotransferase/phosphosugar isomerase protein